MASTDEKCDDHDKLTKFIMGKTENAKFPLCVNSLAREFKDSTETERDKRHFKDRIRSFAREIHRSNEYDTDTKVKVLFALSIPVDYGFLHELKKRAEVELDGSHRIIQYKNTTTQLELSGEHIHVSPLLNERDKSILDFLADFSRKTDARTASSVILNDFQTFARNFDKMSTLQKRFGIIKKEIYELAAFDKRTKIRMIFVSGAEILDYALEELRKDALVELDDSGKIVTYKANDGSLELVFKKPNSDDHEQEEETGRNRFFNPTTQQGGPSTSSSSTIQQNQEGEMNDYLDYHFSDLPPADNVPSTSSSTSIRRAPPPIAPWRIPNRRLTNPAYPPNTTYERPLKSESPSQVPPRRSNTPYRRALNPTTPNRRAPEPRETIQPPNKPLKFNMYTSVNWVERPAPKRPKKSDPKDDYCEIIEDLDAWSREMLEAFVKPEALNFKKEIVEDEPTKYPPSYLKSSGPLIPDGSRQVKMEVVEEGEKKTAPWMSFSVQKPRWYWAPFPSEDPINQSKGGVSEDVGGKNSEAVEEVVVEDPLDPLEELAPRSWETEDGSSRIQVEEPQKDSEDLRILEEAEVAPQDPEDPKDPKDPQDSTQEDSDAQEPQKDPRFTPEVNLEEDSEDPKDPENIHSEEIEENPGSEKPEDIVTVDEEVFDMNASEIIVDSETPPTTPTALGAESAKIIEKTLPIIDVKSIKSEIKSEIDADLRISVTRHIQFLESIHSMMTVLDLPSLEHLQNRIEAKIRKIRKFGNLEEKVVETELRAAIFASLIIISKWQTMNSVENPSEYPGESIDLKEFLLVYRTTLISLRAPILEFCHQKLKKMMTDFGGGADGGGGGKIPVKKVEAAVRIVLEFIAP